MTTGMVNKTDKKKVYLRYFYVLIFISIIVNIVLGEIVKAQTNSEGSSAATVSGVNAGGGSSTASGSGSSPSSKSKKTHVLNFEDELVRGSSQKPELFYLFQKKNFNYKRLIRLRENFIPEMKKTSEDLKRNRSGN